MKKTLVGLITLGLLFTATPALAAGDEKPKGFFGRIKSTINKISNTIDRHEERINASQHAYWEEQRKSRIDIRIVEPELIEEIDAYCAEHDADRKSAIHELVRKGLEIIH